MMPALTDEIGEAKCVRAYSFKALTEVLDGFSPLNNCMQSEGLRLVSE